MEVDWTCPNCSSEWSALAEDCEQAFIECSKCESVFDIEVETTVFAITEVFEEEEH